MKSVIILVIIGIIFISISSLSEASATAGNKFFFIQKQLLWLVLGTIAFYVFSKINLRFLEKYSKIFYFISLTLLAAVLIPTLGSRALGARRWLDLGTFGIQPSELLKLTSILFFASIFSDPKTRNLKVLLTYLTPAIVMIVLQPNLSTAILIIAIIISIYYLSGGQLKSLFTLCLLIVICSLGLVITSPYRFARLKTLIKPQNNSASYHSNQIILSLASGGWLGKGFANSDQKYKFLPKVSTDSILAVIGEETGFIGITFILFLYFFLINSIFKLSQSLDHNFEFLVICGIGCWITYQSLLNSSAIVALIPLTGIPLPFISYGGSSLVSLLAAMGIIRNLERKQSKLVYSNSENHQNHPHHRSPPHPRH
jgi:cell division protein FtsW